ncbi:ubiquinol-cytochrome-c reductase complex subunit domain-containing protein [Trichoderma velutinum]
MVSQTPFRAAEFKSAYGPKYAFQPNYRGISIQTATRYGFRTAAIGGGLGVALMLYASSLPRFRADVLTKIPIIGSIWEKQEIHPADNPF